MSAHAEPRTFTLLKFTQTGEFQYDLAAVLDFAARNGITCDWSDNVDDLVIAVFYDVYDSEIGRELFYGLNDDSSVDLFTRREDE